MANKMSYYTSLVFYILSAVLCTISFGTGHWYMGPGKNQQFKRLGLWEVCFDGYEHTSDYIGKKYYGCWWIFHKEYAYIRDWITPPWFVAVQTLMTFGVVFEMVTLVLLLMGASDRRDTKTLNSACVGTFMSTLCVGISVTIFGVMVGEDRTWMPRWDIDKLGWSFGLATLSAFFSAFACIAVSVYTLMRRYELLPKYAPAPPHVATRQPQMVRKA